MGKPSTQPLIPDSIRMPGDIPVGIDLKVQTLAGKTYAAVPALLIRERSIPYVPSAVKGGCKIQVGEHRSCQGRFYYRREPVEDRQLLHCYESHHFPLHQFVMDGCFYYGCWFYNQHSKTT